MKDRATPCRERIVLLHDRMERLWTVERCNFRQIKMETAQQVRKHVRNLLETAEDQRALVALCSTVQSHPALLIFYRHEHFINFIVCMYV